MGLIMEVSGECMALFWGTFGWSSLEGYLSGLLRLWDQNFGRPKP